MKKRIIVYAALLIAAVGLTVRLSIPQRITDNSNSSMAACINTLRQIDGAKQQWALEFHKGTNDVPAWPEIAQFIGRDQSVTNYPRWKPVCPLGGEYTIGRVGEAPKCSIGGRRHRIDF